MSLDTGFSSRSNVPEERPRRAISSIRTGRRRAATPSTHWASPCRIGAAARMTLGLTRQNPTVLQTQGSGRLGVENTRANDTNSDGRNNPDMWMLQIAYQKFDPQNAAIVHAAHQLART
jgi:hypothetical protein